MVGRFMEALSCIDPCFISAETLEQLPTPSPVGKTKVRSGLQPSTAAPCQQSRDRPRGSTARVHCLSVGGPGAGLRRLGLPVATGRLRPEKAARQGHGPSSRQATALPAHLDRPEGLDGVTSSPGPSPQASAHPHPWGLGPDREPRIQQPSTITTRTSVSAFRELGLAA
jgi:hypothetical protein